MTDPSHCYFTTIKCLDWKPVLAHDSTKNIVVNSLEYLVAKHRMCLFGFVVMVNHLHLLWRVSEGHKRENVQRDFLKFTAQQILKQLKIIDPGLYKDLWTALSDREYQVWARHSLNVPIWSPAVWRQKLGYIHANPVRAGLCKRREDYKYSSFTSYILGRQQWPFVTVSPSGNGYL